MPESQLFSTAQLGAIELSNRIVMSPMTRSRATVDHVPTEAMAVYYAQRASAGLIITEGTGPSINGTGYARIPGIWNEEQILAWRTVTEAVHDRDGKIFLQLMHTGRASHALNMPEGGLIVAPSAIQAKGSIQTDQEGLQAFAVPNEMTEGEIQDAIKEFVQAATNAITAGFDGVELHGANGYLIEEFIRPSSNKRTDAYGGSTENYARFLLEVAKEIAEVIGKDRLGVKLSPYGEGNDMPYDQSYDEIYKYLADQLTEHVTYVHLISKGEETQALESYFRQHFNGTLILNGGYTKEKAEEDIAKNNADLISFGQLFIANPDLPERFLQNAPLAEADPTTFYTPGEKGYTDYPKMDEE
ncbi:alkene reductase [Siphonobacter sp. SORGH_AS_0500]|uniref:alkene reductase n=1 Tax=Siphonobacter sp. SORGH_AS_0500 TaxID=1864824 RepID=UPI000CCB262E|nr:alkene reductase [Siphonobacter sp. SORGH_AS_0500]PKK38093.1 alkene reductase [Siphonobacter sp. SORGH_AS_0500]